MLHYLLQPGWGHAPRPRRPRRRWNDNDRHLGPFTFSRGTYRPLAIVLDSGDGDDHPGCHIRFHAFGLTLICELPAIIKPYRQWVDLQYEPAYGVKGYWDIHAREYGVRLTNGHFNIMYGAQTNSSDTEQRWSCFLPWTEWRCIAHRIYNADGILVVDVSGSNWKNWDERQSIVDNAVRARFSVIDYDGSQIEVATRIEELEWRLGTGYFRWLGYLAPRKRRRALDLAFSDEIGPEKGSWKGGIVGHSIEMLDGETPDQAMRRYCELEHNARGQRYRISFVGAL